MLDPARLLADSLGAHLAESYTRAFGGSEPRFAGIIAEAARLMMERLAGSDALYRDGLLLVQGRALYPGWHPLPPAHDGRAPVGGTAAQPRLRRGA